MILSVRDLTVAYGPVVAIRAASFEISGGSIVAIIGANGAGKTSLMRGLMSQIRPRGGRVLYEGRDVTGVSTHRLVRSGMTIVPQDRGTLSPLTVDENLLLAGIRLSRAERNTQCRTVFDIFPLLYERRAVKAGLLSGGEQQMLAFGRALVTKPKLLLLDEPSTGLSPRMTSAIMGTIETLRHERDITILVVEQNVAAVLAVADYAYVLDRGRIVREGSAQTLRDDEEVQAAFIGV
jgi:branched-chain amino acid transport system ATP-binding protein